MQGQYRFHDDPGHGWLEVPLADIRELGLESQISSCSYTDGANVYLEEDGDAPRFINAYKARFGEAPRETSVSHNGDAPCRRLRPYTP